MQPLSSFDIYEHLKYSETVPKDVIENTLEELDCLNEDYEELQEKYADLEKTYYKLENDYEDQGHDLDEMFQILQEIREAYTEYETLKDLKDAIQDILIDK